MQISTEHVTMLHLLFKQTSRGATVTHKVLSAVVGWVGLHVDSMQYQYNQMYNYIQHNRRSLSHCPPSSYVDNTVTSWPQSSREKIPWVFQAFPQP